LGNFLGTWGPRIVLSAATVLGIGTGVALNCSQTGEPDPYAEAAAGHVIGADGDAPDSGDEPPIRAMRIAEDRSRFDAGTDPFKKLTDGEGDAGTPGIVIPSKEEVEKYGIPADTPKEDLSYEINLFGRQVAGPVVECVMLGPSMALDGIGAYRMIYAHHAQQPQDAMYASAWQRATFSPSTRIGRTFRRALPNNIRNRPAGVSEQIYLHRSGAGFRSLANGIITIPFVVRLGSNLVAIKAIEDNGTNGIGDAEKRVIYADTANVTSHVANFALFTAAFRQIAKGNGSQGTRTLAIGHGFNIIGDVFAITSGALRLYAESEREDNTGESNPAAYFYSFMDMAYGAIGILFSLYCLSYLRSARRKKKEEEGEELESYKANNILSGIFDYHPVVRESMRTISTLGASAAFGVNSSNLINVLVNPDLHNASELIVSSPLGLAGSALALGSAYLMTPANLALSRLFMAGGALFIASQTIHDLWPLIQQLMSML